MSLFVEKLIFGHCWLLLGCFHLFKKLRTNLGRLAHILRGSYHKRKLSANTNLNREELSECYERLF